ncbi:uncharacterized protein LODBEIA_P41310 [Lodderomyces beijingensis]|uniref:Uncharacterized protein n=1 Tax=Lodderomyces beijingensis TaxID=1775926 RepID=A0ABP0ZRD2_9ASCO
MLKELKGNHTSSFFRRYLPLFPKSRYIRRSYILVPFFVAIIFFLHYISTTDVVRSLTLQLTTPKIPISSFRVDDGGGLVIYPSNFDENTPGLEEPAEESENQIVQFNGATGPLSSYIRDQKFKPHEFTLFASKIESASEEETHLRMEEVCQGMKIKKNVTITQSIRLKEDWPFIVGTLIKQVKNERAFRELSDFFQGKLQSYIDKDELDEKHFYKFASTSVWLAKHGVHLMVSRVLFSQTAKKDDPQISLLYAQLWDENWKELKRVELVVPVINEHGERIYENMEFPRFMPIPFYHNADRTKKRWYGPEDTRLLLTKNEYGDEEPIVIFNSFHRQVVEISNKALNDDVVRTKYGFFRSMFMGYLFRYQIGKQNTDGQQDKKYEKVRYNKVAELRIDEQNRQKTEKNWTPFINPSERSTATHYGDKYMYIVYQWDHLKVLRCELANPGPTSRCTEIFKQDDTAIRVGPVRGGTELIPVTLKNKKKVNKGLKQAWIGFLRAHLNRCGCGKAMYRPNFIVLAQHQNGNFQISYLSSSISMNIPVVGWNDASVQCARRDPNVLIPNGISMYEPQLDYLTLTLSVADKDDNLVHLKGIQQMIENLNMKWDGNLGQSKQVECVVDESIDFCKKYADLQDSLGLSEDSINLAKQAGKISDKPPAGSSLNGEEAEEEVFQEAFEGLDDEEGKSHQQDEHPGEDNRDSEKAPQAKEVSKPKSEKVKGKGKPVEKEEDDKGSSWW